MEISKLSQGRTDLSKYKDQMVRKCWLQRDGIDNVLAGSLLALVSCDSQNIWDVLADSVGSDFE